MPRNRGTYIEGLLSDLIDLGVTLFGDVPLQRDLQLVQTVVHSLAQLKIILLKNNRIEEIAELSYIRKNSMFSWSVQFNWLN